MALTDMVARQAKATGKSYTLGDIDGLSLSVNAQGGKSWHFRYTWLGKQKRMSLGRYPEIGLRDARIRRDEARILVAQGINPCAHRKLQQQSACLAAKHTFEAVYEKWLAHRGLSLKSGRQTTLSVLPRVFAKDVLPTLAKRSIHDVTRADLLDILGRIEQRKALSVAEKVRTWFNQLFRYALVIVPGLERNPAFDLDVVAVPQPPVRHNPFLRMPELPALLQALRKYPGRHQTQLGVRLLLLTGVRTGELRRATPDQFHLDQGLWIIPPEVVKQLQLRMLKDTKTSTDIPPYIVPLSEQAMEIVRFLLDRVKPAQRYLLHHDSCLKQHISENTLNTALKRLGYDDRLTGHGIRGTISTALNEIGYPKVWIEAQLSHADRDKVSAAYNHAEYVEQRRRMMQDWADRLDLFEQDQTDAASTTLSPDGPFPRSKVQLGTSSIPVSQTAAPQHEAPCAPVPPAQRLSAVRIACTDNQRIIPSIQRERMLLLDQLEAPHNLSVAEYAQLVGKSRRWISYEIQAGHLLAIHLGNRGQRVPDWHLDPIKHALIQNVLQHVPRSVDSWAIYHALLHPHDALGARSPIEAVTAENLLQMVQAVVGEVSAGTTQLVESIGH